MQHEISSFEIIPNTEKAVTNFEPEDKNEQATEEEIKETN